MLYVKTYFHENNIHILGLQVFMRDQMIERNASEDYFIFGLNKNKSFIRGRGLRASQMVWIADQSKKAKNVRLVGRPLCWPQPWVRILYQLRCKQEQRKKREIHSYLKALYKKCCFSIDI
jgi:hypothetical protein